MEYGLGEEEAWVRRAAKGDRCAFALLADRYRPGLRRAIAKVTAVRESQ